MKCHYILCFIFFLFISQTSSSALEPNKVPFLKDFEPLNIKPGESGIFRFSILNRYESTIKNISLSAEIYKYGTIKEGVCIDKIYSPPKITDEKKYIAVIEPNQTFDISFSILTSKQTPQGTYFLRFKLEFEHNGTNYTMKSRGWFGDELWNKARLNLTELNVSGLLPDSSFSVKEPISLIPYYFLIALAIFLTLLATIFYLVEKERCPRLKKRFYYWKGKFNQFWKFLKK
ncbi:MAG: hypothetical protein AB1779_08355 [Candidatus Thermoplasmatota archaeon]